jgi:GNAT superfamily N-acetyltransferase
MREVTLTLEPAHAVDAHALADLRVAAMRDSLERAGRFDPDRARMRFLATFSPAHTHHVCRNGERIGVVVVRPGRDAWHLEHLYIHPDHQRAGVGAATLARVFADADAARMPLRVGALTGSDANRFYVRHGFVFESATAFDTYYVRAPGCDTPVFRPRVS